MSSRNSMQKAAMRPGDFHLRADARQLFGNYVELSPAGGQGALKNVRKAASVVETPVYSEPRLWKISVLFGGPRAVPALPLTPWVPALGAIFGVTVTVRTALDRDKAVGITQEDLVPLDAHMLGADTPSAFKERFIHGHQVGITVETTGSIAFPAALTRTLGVQVSIVPVDSGDRDPYGNSFVQQFAQSNVSQLFLAPNQERRQVYVQNWGTTPLYLAFGDAAAAPGGSSPECSIILPGKGDVWESLRDVWQGAIAGVWDLAGSVASDTALVTEGT
jgi:hypothetical protein